MKRMLFHLFFILSFTFTTKNTLAQNANTPLNRVEINNYVERQLLETNDVFYWKNASDHFLWSAVVQSDSIITIGYKPPLEKNINTNMHLINVDEEKWATVREQLIDFVLTENRTKYGDQYTEAYLFPFGKKRPLPYINVRVFDLETIAALRTMSEVRYLDPMGYDITKESAVVRSDQGCGGASSAINPADYTTITPAARQSWHHLDLNIDAAWTNSTKGENIWIAVIDTGCSDTQSKLNGSFAEGDSGGRQVEHYGFFSPNSDGVYDGWEDQCGHGTSMSGLAAAPRGFDDTPAGVAYKANLITYRSTSDVLIGSSNEQDGVSLSFYTAGNDSRVHIISISLGDIFYSNQVADAIIYASNLGKLIFAAGGTSTTVTTWYGVIFPASMDETVAVTGITDAAVRTTCDVCHDGSEIDFVVCMQRDSDADRTGLTLDLVDLNQGYVGGSSNSTATMAGVAALVWGNNPTWNKGQVLNRLIQSADNFPNRSDTYGWGKVDVDLAVTPAATNMTCDPALSNEVTIEITNISFPSYPGDAGSENEWVLTLDGASYYFDVDENGASGNPASFMDMSVCGSIPMTVDLGTTTCGSASLNLIVKSHENDSAGDNCSLDFFDDAEATQTISIDITNNTFTHSSPAGDFVFTYSSSCTATANPAVSISGNATLCQNGPTADLTFFFSGGTAPYTATYTLNNGTAQTIVSDIGDIATLTQSTAMAGTFIYELVSVVDANGCSQAAIGTTTITVLAANDPICTGCSTDYMSTGNGGLTGNVAGIEDYETDGGIESVQTIEGTAIVDYDSGTEITLLPGFNTILGATICIFIDGCDNGGGGVNVVEETTEAQ